MSVDVSSHATMTEPPSPEPRRLLASTGDPNDPHVMSGLPYHFLLYGSREGLIEGGITRSLRPAGLTLSRWTWNACQVMTMRGIGGHQYTYGRNSRLWLSPPAGATIINIFQLYPRHLLDAEVRRWYFIDQTLRQLFFGYRQVDRLARGVLRRTLQWETECYHAAEMVVANSRWAATSLTDDYGVPADRVAVVPQAANLLPEAYEAWAAARVPVPRSESDPLRLVFLGGDWQRKGLDRLLEAMQLVNGRQRLVTLDVIGCEARRLPADVAATPHVTWHGHVNKHQNPNDFLDLLGRADVGCLLSRAEAGGNALREYHAVGLAVLGTTAGGAPEQTLDGASWLVDPADTATDLADRLRWLTVHPEEVERYKACSWERRQEVLWPATLRGMRELLEAHGA